jgi:hypothetical protein
MKKLILIFAILASTMSYATKLTCVAVTGGYNSDTNVGTLTGADVEMECRNNTNKEDRKKYTVTITTHGPAAYIAKAEGFAIECPFNPEPEGTYYGVDADAGLAIGLGLGVFASRDGLCILGSAALLKFGAALTAGKLEITSSNYRY